MLYRPLDATRTAVHADCEFNITKLNSERLEYAQPAELALFLYPLCIFAAALFAYRGNSIASYHFQHTMYQSVLRARQIKDYRHKKIAPQL